MERTTATKLLIKDTLNFSVPLGSIPELPAISCREIEASEGKYNISNKHWLDSSLTGQAELVDCSDTVKGVYYTLLYLLHILLHILYIIHSSLREN